MLDTKVQLHPVTLKFQDPELEKIFLIDYARDLLKQSRAAIIMGMIFLLAYAIFDWLLFPELALELITARVIGVFMLVGVLLATYTSLFEKWNQLILSIGAVIAGFILISLIAILEPEQGFIYYMGLGQLVAFIYILLGIRIVYGVATNIITIGSYNLLIILYKAPSADVLININAFLIGISLVVAMGGYLLELYKRNAFYQLRLISNLKEKAEQASVEKSRFLASMSHELRTPLNAIIGYSEMLEEDAKLSNNKQQEDDLGRVKSAGNHLLRLINNVLDLAKIESGKIELFNEITSVPALLYNIEATARSLSLRNGNQFVSRVGDVPEIVSIDGMRLSQILLNLISNACKFTSKGIVTMSMSKTDGHKLRFEVIDTGIGMDHETIDSIFEDYKQADSTIAREYGGSGLGLAISRQLCNLMSGTIVVNSEPGKGSTFTVEIPYADPF